MTAAPKGTAMPKPAFVLFLFVASTLPVHGAPAAKSPPIPQLGFSDYAWSKSSDDFQDPHIGAGPVISDKDHPYINNIRAAEGGRPITLRVADLNNPILKPWVVEQMRKANELALAGKS